MENSTVPAVNKDQSSASGKPESKLLRYPLRSSTRSEKKTLVDSPNSVSVSKRAASSVSKSVSSLHFSGKDKSAKPPRRLSIPSKSNVRPVPKPLGSFTPISEVRAKRSAISQGKTDAALADVSKSFGRKKVSVLSSASYWLSQIKLSESAAMHSVSLGFFKLALEAGCEPRHKMSAVLTSYVRRYNLSEPEELVKELLERYNVSETLGQSKVSETSQVSVEGNNVSDQDNIHGSSSSVTEAVNLVPKSLDKVASESTNVVNAKKIDPVKRLRSSVTKNMASSKAVSEVRKSTTVKKPEKPVKQEPATKKDNIKLEKKSDKLAEGTLKSEPEETLKENKENMNASQTEEGISVEA